jgi:hypothetical protein
MTAVAISPAVFRGAGGSAASGRNSAPGWPADTAGMAPVLPPRRAGW